MEIRQDKTKISQLSNNMPSDNKDLNETLEKNQLYQMNKIDKEIEKQMYINYLINHPDEVKRLNTELIKQFNLNK
jgi:hypothetical protein